MSKNLEGYIECPFYLDYSNNTITCEGVCDDSVTVHSFHSKPAFKAQMKKFCTCDGGKNCDHFKAVTLLYERGLRH